MNSLSDSEIAQMVAQSHRDRVTEKLKKMEDEIASLKPSYGKHCVNCHDDLLEALKVAATSGAFMYMTQEEKATIVNALDKAEGEQQ